MDWSRWLFWVGICSASGIAVLWGVSSYYHFRYYVLRAHEPEKWKIQPSRFLKPSLQHLAMLLSTSNLLIAGVFTGTLITGIDQLPIYFEVEDYGWLYTISTTVLFFLLIDASAYYVHRFLHVRTVFRRLHRWHHKFLAPTPWVVIAMHPAEFILLQASALWPVFIMPMHYVSILLVLFYALVFNIIDHSGVRLFSRLPWQGPSIYHDDHHVHFHCNFGQHLMLWDRLHGTLRRRNRRYGEDVFGGKGAREMGADDDDFVSYS